MNKLQQEIIEIIEPYMDKTLSEGCLIKDKADDNSIEIIKVDKEMKIEWNKVIYTCDTTELIKIIGHYDITAVLKYIDATVWNSYLDFLGYSQYEIVLYDKYSKLRMEIPNKPLHLFTEQENKDLLEILKELQ